MTRDDSGAAFPRPAGHNGLKSADKHSSNEPQDGMTLRDYFAADAPISYGDAWIVCGYKEAPFLDKDRATAMAILSLMRYEYADAMLAERAKETAR